MVAIQYIEGACVEQIYLNEFDLANILDWLEITVEDITANPDDENDVSDHNIDIGDSTTTVTIFKSDGEAKFFIGLTSDWNK